MAQILPDMSVVKAISASENALFVKVGFLVIEVSITNPSDQEYVHLIYARLASQTLVIAFLGASE